MPAFMNTVDGRAIEWSSGSIQSNAHSMAKLAAVFANNGALAGYKPLFHQASTLDSLVSEPKYAYDHYLNSSYSFTKGGYCSFGGFDDHGGLVSKEFRDNMQGFSGWGKNNELIAEYIMYCYCQIGGLGGSIWVYNREKNVGLAYMMNGMHVTAIGGVRTDRIMKAVQSVLAKIK